MTRSLKNIYPQKYEELKKSEHYIFLNKTQVENNEAKELCKQLAEHKCKICGDKGLDAHHIKPLKEGGTNDQDNLICLCRKCHQQVHKGVYTIDPESKTFSAREFDTHLIQPNDKPIYVEHFEKIIETTIYKHPTGRYYAFINGVKTFIPVKEMKEKTGYQPASHKMDPEKRRSINDRKILETYKKEYKEKGDLTGWHMICRAERNWDKYPDEIKDHIMNCILKM